MTHSGSKQMSKGAQKIMLIFRKAGARVIPEYEFPDLRGKKGIPLRYDFLIQLPGGAPFLVEYDGEAHFEQIKFFQRKTSDFKKAQERDRIKNKYALMHGIPLYRIPYWKIDEINTVKDILNNYNFLVKNKYHNDLLKAP